MDNTENSETDNVLEMYPCLSNLDWIDIKRPNGKYPRSKAFFMEFEKDIIIIK